METEPKRIQRKRTKGFNLQEYSKSLNGLKCVVVTRPTKWGNPFAVGKYLNAWGKAFVAIRTIELKGTDVDGIREIYDSGVFDKPVSLENSLKWYRLWVDFKIKSGTLNLEELRNKNLACFCPLDVECHADILIELLVSHKKSRSL